MSTPLCYTGSLSRRSRPAILALGGVLLAVFECGSLYGATSVPPEGGSHPVTDASWPVGPGAAHALPPLPSPAGPPTSPHLRAMLQALATVPAVPLPRKPVAVTLDDDWLTEGSWLGRRGRYWACLNAMVTDMGAYLWGGNWEIVDMWAGIGPDARRGDQIRDYVTWLYTTNPHVLEMPYPYLQTRVTRKLTTWGVNRRQAEFDDHGETYPMTQDGPHLYFNIRVPPGWYFLSFYDYNKDGHTASNRYRDYAISVRSRNYHDDDWSIEGFDKSPELAHSRLSYFWGGVWKRFLVHGPALYSIQINRNNSFNTIMAAEMLDTLDEFPPPYQGTPDEWLLRQNARRTKVAQEQMSGEWKKPPAAAAEAELAGLTLQRLEYLRLTNAEWWAVNSRRFYAVLLRWYRARAGARKVPASKDLSAAATCAYRLGLFDEWEAWQKREGLRTARDVEQHLRMPHGATPGYREASGHEFEIASQYVEARLEAGP